jgi:hypothetical protein
MSFTFDIGVSNAYIGVLHPYILKGGSSTIQNDVDDLINQSEANKFQMNEGKCKDEQIEFS